MTDIVGKLLAMGEDVFLSGDPDGDRELDIDDIFAKGWDRAHGEMTRCRSDWEKVDWAEAIVTASEHQGFAFVQNDDGLLLLDLDGSRIVGGVVGGADLVLHRDYHGRGLGMEIVQEYFVRNDALPTWGHDEACYSRDGEAVCRRAYQDFLKRPDAARARVKRFDDTVPGAFVPEREPTLLPEATVAPVVA